VASRLARRQAIRSGRAGKRIFCLADRFEAAQRHAGCHHRARSATPMADDRYRPLDLIGSGPTGAVYRAVDTATDREVALKILTAALADDTIAVERLERDLARVREIAHPALLAGELVVRGDGSRCVVMPFVDGESLRPYIARHQPVDAAAAVALLRQLLAALAACHARGLLHRDLKPSNVMVGSDGTLTLLDLGLAQLTGRGDPARRATTPLDAPQYLAPEQHAGGLADARGDLYAAGVLAFEILTGAAPHDSDAAPSARAAQLAARRRGLPPWLPQWVERLLAPHIETRYQTAAEALEDLTQRRVIAAAIPALPHRRCPQCGEQTLRARTACVVCGWDAQRMLTPGDRNVWRRPDTDTARLMEYGEELFGTRTALRGRRLLLAGVDDGAAEVVCNGAAAGALSLDVRPRSPWADLRGAIPIAVACIIARGIFEQAMSKWDYFGWYFFDQVDTLQTMQFIAPAVLLWVCVRNIRREAVLPAWRLAPPAPPREAQTEAIITAGRPTSWHAIGLRLAERQAVLDRGGAHGDASWLDALRGLVAAATRLIAPLSEADTRLRDPALLLRLHDCAAALRIPDVAQDAERRLRVYYDAIDRLAVGRARLCAADAFLTHVAGRILVLQQGLDAATRAATEACRADLTAAADDVPALERALADLA
jgi:hypothetical protein